VIEQTVETIENAESPLGGSENIVTFIDTLDRFKKNGVGVVGLAKYFQEAGLQIDYDTMHRSADSERSYTSVVWTVKGAVSDGTIVDVSMRHTDSEKHNGRSYRQSVGITGLLDADAMHLRESWDLASSRREGREGSGLHVLKEGYDPVAGSEHYQTFMRHEQRN